MSYDHNANPICCEHAISGKVNVHKLPGIIALIDSADQYR